MTLSTQPYGVILEPSRSHDRCPACRRGRLEVFFEVPQAPVLCNILCATREAAMAVPRGPIRLGFCGTCGHVYNVAFDEGLMRYDGAYENSLQFSPLFRRYLEDLADGLVRRYDLFDKDVIEIGCGQGDFLSLLCRTGRNRGTGFDPSFDLAKADTAVAPGVEIIPELYSHAHERRPVDLLCCRHVLEHIPQPLEFLREIRRTLGSRAGTVLFFEVPNALFTLDRLAVWDVIYEHCSYFTPASLRRLFEHAGFHVLRLAEAYDGQFLTIEARPSECLVGSNEPVAPGLVESVRNFEAAQHAKVGLWQERLERLRGDGVRSVVWGAGSKGVTFLNALSVPHDEIPYAVDLNPRKHGRFVVGTGQEIVPPAELRRYRPQWVIIMNAVYAREIGQTLRELGVNAETVTAG